MKKIFSFMRKNIFFHENNLKNKTETVRKNC